MSHPIAIAGRRGLTDPNKPRRNHLCQKYARLCVTDAVGHKYDTWLWQDNAVLAARALIKGNFAFLAGELKQHGGLQSGDLLYKTTGSGGDGHVGIYDDPQHIYENSTVHWIRSGEKDARGIRTLEQFGHFDVVARLPLPTPEPPPAIEVPTSIPEKDWLCVWNGLTLPMVMVENRPYVAIRELLENVKHEVTAYNDQTKQTGRFYVNSRQKPQPKE
jgi:hypothetical protein